MVFPVFCLASGNYSFLVRCSLCAIACNGKVYAPCTFRPGVAFSLAFGRLPIVDFRLVPTAYVLCCWSLRILWTTDCGLQTVGGALEPLCASICNDPWLMFRLCNRGFFILFDRRFFGFNGMFIVGLLRFDFYILLFVFDRAIFCDFLRYVSTITPYIASASFNYFALDFALFNRLLATFLNGE